MVMVPTARYSPLWTQSPDRESYYRIIMITITAFHSSDLDILDVVPHEPNLKLASSRAHSSDMISITAVHEFGPNLPNVVLYESRITIRDILWG